MISMIFASVAVLEFRDYLRWHDTLPGVWSMSSICCDTAFRNGAVLKYFSRAAGFWEVPFMKDVFHPC